MNPSNRTIEEKLAIVQQLKSNSNSISVSKQKSTVLSEQLQEDEAGHSVVFSVIRFIICIILFGVFIFIGNRNPDFYSYVNAMITTEENGNLIDFMSPFTYTLQETE